MPNLSTALARFHARPTHSGRDGLSLRCAGTACLPSGSGRRATRFKGQEQVETVTGFILVGEPIELPPDQGGQEEEEEEHELGQVDRDEL